MIVRTVILFLFTVIIVMAPLQNSSDGREDNNLELVEINPNDANSKTVNFQNQNLSNAEVLELTKDFDDGKKTPETIQGLLNAVAGDQDPGDWANMTINEDYQVTQILTHVQDLDSGFELLYNYFFPDEAAQEESFTYYTRRVQEADEQSVSSSIALPLRVKNNNGKPTFDFSSRLQYDFFLKKSDLFGSFSLRPPVGAHNLGLLNSNSFDPLSLFEKTKGLNIADEPIELMQNDTHWLVTVLPRITDMQTLTIEIQARKVDTLVTYTQVLVYETITKHSPITYHRSKLAQQ